MKTTKTILAWLLVTLLSNLLLVSCSPSLNIAKRHYNPGYYVSFESRNKKKTEKKLILTEPTTVSQQIANEEKTSTETTINNSDKFPLTASLNKTQPVMRINHSIKPKETDLSAAVPNKTNHTFPIISFAKNLKRKHTDSIIQQINQPNRDGDPSKDWAVIVGIILLILFCYLPFISMIFFRIGFESTLSSIAKAGWWTALAFLILEILVVLLAIAIFSSLA